MKGSSLFLAAYITVSYHYTGRLIFNPVRLILTIMRQVDAQAARHDIVED